MHHRRQAAVLLLLCPTDAGFFLPLTVRHRSLADHPGQVSLPGGRVERGETHWEAVLRETEEELGVDSGVVQMLGPLPSIYVFASNYRVQPYVAWANQEISFRPNETEVESIVPFPVFPMEGVPARTQRTLQKKGHEMRAVGWVHENQFIWGATALILESFFATLGVNMISPREVTSNAVGRSSSGASSS